MVRWGASLHRPKAGRARVRGASPARALWNRCLRRNSRSAPLFSRQPAGRGLEGPSQSAARGGGKGGGLTSWGSHGLLPGCEANPRAPFLQATSLTSPQKGPVPRPRPPEGLPARLQRALGILPWGKLPWLGLLPPRSEPSDRRTPSRHASVPFGERCRANPAGRSPSVGSESIGLMRLQTPRLQ